jgi:hypothetical protein
MSNEYLGVDVSGKPCTMTGQEQFKQLNLNWFSGD